MDEVDRASWLMEYTARHMPQRGSVPEEEFRRRAVAAAKALYRYEVLAGIREADDRDP